MAYKLVVTDPFGAHAKGDMIEDPAEMAAVLEEHESHVVRVGEPDAAPDAPAPDAKPAKSADPAA